MAITINLPPNIELQLRAASPDLDHEATESLLVQSYRQGRLNRKELTDLVGMSKYELDGLLKRHGVTEDLLTPEELSRQLDSI